MNGPRRLAEVFVELADTLVAEFDVVDLMQVLTERSVELLNADAAGLMLTDERGNLRLMASTTDARVVELLELQIADGPCREAFLSGVPVVNVRLVDARERWPVFTAAAVTAG